MGPLCVLLLSMKWPIIDKTQICSCSIDASKMFDRVRHDTLLLLIEIGIPAAIIRSMYDHDLMVTGGREWGLVTLGKGQNPLRH